MGNTIFDDLTIALSDMLDNTLDALTLQPLTALRGFFKPCVHVWIRTSLTCRQVQEIVDKAKIDGWSYIKQNKGHERYIEFMCAKTDVEKAKKIRKWIEEEYP